MTFLAENLNYAPMVDFPGTVRSASVRTWIWEWIRMGAQTYNHADGNDHPHSLTDGLLYTARYRDANFD